MSQEEEIAVPVTVTGIKIPIFAICGRFHVNIIDRNDRVVCQVNPTENEDETALYRRAAVLASYINVAGGC